jgi:ABC-type Fe3+-hydroxamate transport system substrate-binding protein
MKTTIRIKTVVSLLLPLTALSLAGCWTPPNAQVQPNGEARLIQSGVTVEIVQNPATVESINAGQRTIALQRTDGLTKTYTIGPKVKHLDRITAGNQVKAKLTEEFAVYLLANGRLPNGATAQSLGVNAKVLLVDPSYRLLTLQYPNGQYETFKAGLDTKLLEMAPGDDVVAQPREVTALRIEKQ